MEFLKGISANELISLLLAPKYLQNTTNGNYLQTHLFTHRMRVNPSVCAAIPMYPNKNS